MSHGFLSVYLIASLIGSVLTVPSVYGADDHLRIAQSDEPATLDVMDASDSDVAALRVGGLIFDTLLERGPMMELLPALAVNVPKSSGPLTWEVALRKGVKFHNGENFDAQSVKFSLERLLTRELKLRGAVRFSKLRKVEIVDPYLVRLHTSEPWPTLPGALATIQAAMYAPKAAVQSDRSTLAVKPIGTGPYKLQRWSSRESIVLELNPIFWRAKPRWPTVTFFTEPEETARVAALRTGSADVALPISPRSGAEVAKDPRLSLRSTPSLQTVQLVLYVNAFDAEHRVKGPFGAPTADKRVRRAIATVIDVDAIIRNAFGGKANRIATMLTPLHFGFEPQIVRSSPDLRLARKWLSEAGFPNGIDLALNFPQELADVAVDVATQLKQAEIRMKLQPLDATTFLIKVMKHEAGPVTLTTWRSALADADGVYRPLFRSGQPRANWQNDRFDVLVDQASLELDPGKRRALYHEATAVWLDDFPSVPLVQRWIVYGARLSLALFVRGDGGFGVTKCDCPNDKTCCPTSDDCKEYRQKNTCPT
jgi:peptide/nickel transport system substrate-binding protein